MSRVFLAALLGGLAMFIWSAVAHMVLPLGEAGLKEVRDESVLDSLQTGIQEPGLYVLPGFGLGPDAPAAQKKEAMQHLDERLARYPSGLLMFFPKGGRSLAMGRWLAVEFATEVVEAFLVVFLLSLTRLTTYGARLGFVMLAGLLAALATNVSYWNWYGFPAVYTAAYITTQLVGFFCVGIVAALLLRPRAG